MTSFEYTTKRQSGECGLHFSTDFKRDNVVSGGSTAIVERLLCGHVRKIPFPDASQRGRKNSLQDITREHEVYRRIANLPHFLEMIEFSAEQGIVLQGMPDGTLRHYLETYGPSILLSKRLTWAYDIAAALHSLHSAGVIHGDLKPENVLLDENTVVYLIDFSGSWIDGQPGSALESVRFFKPRSVDSDSTMQTDLFALGSTLYEIFTGTQPYSDLADDMVEERFGKGHFPSLESIPCERVIRGCWEGTIHRVSDVVAALRDELSSSRPS